MTDKPESEPVPSGEVVRVVDFLRLSLHRDEAEQVHTAQMAKVLARREKVLALYRSKTMHEVAAELSISSQTVFEDIKAILESTRRRILLASTELLVHMVSELTDLERDIREQWERSKRDGKKTVTKVKGKLSNRPGTTRNSQGQNQQQLQTTGTEKEDHTEVIERIGDPRLAALLLQIHQRKCKLLGLETDEKPEDKEPAVKVLSDEAWGAV